MPDDSKEPICKEGVIDAIIPGCGPLPAPDGLSWRTKSGRPIQVKSTVYEVYYPICIQNGGLNRDLQSIRCGEDLRWNASIQGLRSLYGICVGVGGLLLAAVMILIVYVVCRSRQNPPAPTKEPEDAPLKESTFTVSNTPGEQQPETMGDLVWAAERAKNTFLQNQR